jgi:hypothetical protein
VIVMKFVTMEAIVLCLEIAQGDLNESVSAVIVLPQSVQVGCLAPAPKMKILLVFGSLFVFANAKNGHGGHHNNHNNVVNSAVNALTPAVDPLQCFQTLLLSFDFSAPASDAESQVLFRSDTYRTTQISM